MSLVETIGRAILALAAVLFVVWLLARGVGRKQRRSGSVVDVLGRTQLSKHASIAVVRIGDRDVVIGVTENRVSLLGDAPGLRTPHVVEDVAPPAIPAAVAVPTVPAAVGAMVQPGDLLITMGAGDVTMLGPQLLNHLEQR